MRALKLTLAIFMSIIIFIGCSSSKVLEKNTKEEGLSKYKVTYKHLSSNYFKDGYLFSSLYEKNNEFYGLARFYPKNGDSNLEPDLLYKIDWNGNFMSYKNETITSYLEDSQVKNGSLEDKGIYIRGLYTQDINYYYSDFENEELKSIPWIKEYYDELTEKENKIKINSEKISSYSNYFEDNGLKIHEFNSKASYYLEDETLKDIPNYKFIYYVDIEKEKFYISDIIEEEPSLNYYYNYEDESFIKINKDGTSNKIKLKEGSMKIEDYDLDLQYALKDKIDDKSYNYRQMNLKYYSTIGFTDKRGSYNLLVIDKKNKSSKIYKEHEDLDKAYRYLSNNVPNSNYFFTLVDDKGYIGVVNEDLILELIGEVDMKLDIYNNSGGFVFGIDGNKEGNKILINIYSNNQQEGKYQYENIQYILVNIE